MSKGKLAKFADMAAYPNVFEFPFNRLDDAPCPLRGRWHEEVFHNNNPIVLELGCGRGEYAVGLARRHAQRTTDATPGGTTAATAAPEPKNFIGVDIKGARMWTGATAALREGLTNVVFLRTNIEIIDRFFAPGEVSEIWLTFSDPQMKKATKRLTSTYFLQRYLRFLADGGAVHLKTDSNFLFTYTRHVCLANQLPIEACTEDLHAQTPDAHSAALLPDIDIRTYYEQMWMDRGLAIRYLRFRLPALTADRPTAEVLTEPDIDIPLDDYRSYSREKRSSLTTAR